MALMLPVRGVVAWRRFGFLTRVGFGASAGAFALAMAMCVKNAWVGDVAYIVFRSVEQLLCPEIHVLKRILGQSRGPSLAPRNNTLCQLRE